MAGQWLENGIAVRKTTRDEGRDVRGEASKETDNDRQ